ncbi:MAG: PQQ-binding-like beta-propeller repeat protein [Alphaproteobacteria bacterium]|nr:PQQ-binding-like beta-propeller repeat protein [Alphaproteobacteria bacterium]
MSPARRALLLLPLVATVLLGGGATVGWRRDGGGTWPGATPATSWSATEHVAWSTPIAQWSNASPVLAGDLVCVCAEPTTLVCVDKATGAVRWTASHAIVDAVPADQRAAVAQAIADKDRLQAEYTSVRAEYGKVLRRARSAGDPALTAQSEEMAARIDALKAQLEAIPEYRTPADQDMIGWSSPTPVSDGKGVYALYANGVVAAHELDGTLRWSHWQGPRLDRMLGWDEGQSASPVLVDGVLVVPFRALTGIDARTGAVLWTGEPWPHFGAPTPMTIGGTGVVVTPSGRVVRARDGKVLAEGLADMWYVAPVVDGDTVLFFEARAAAQIKKDGGVRLKAYRIGPVTGDTVKTEALWTAMVPETEVYYAAPVVLGDHIHVLSSAGSLVTLDRATGAVLGTEALTGLRPTVFYASPSAAGGRLYLTDESGRTAVLSSGPKPALEGVNTTFPSRASLTFDGSRIYMRTRQGLMAIDGGGQ